MVASVVSKNDCGTNKDLDVEEGRADATGAEEKKGVAETASGDGAATTVDVDSDISAKKDDEDKVNGGGGGGDEVKCCSNPIEEKKKNVDNWTSPMRTDNNAATNDTINDDVKSNENSKATAAAATAASAAPIKVDPPPKPRPIIPLSKQFDELDEFQEFLTTIPHGPMNSCLLYTSPSPRDSR